MCVCMCVCVYLSECVCVCVCMCVHVCACWSLVMDTVYTWHSKFFSSIQAASDFTHTHTHTDCTTYPELPTLNVANEHCTSTSSNE